jgi:hypothetical protein
MVKGGAPVTGRTGISRVLIQTGTICLLALAITGCDVAMYDPDAVRGAQASQDLARIGRRTFSRWDATPQDAIIEPGTAFGFYPDAVDRLTGYLVYEDGAQLKVRRIGDEGISRPVALELGADTVHADWDAWLVPIDPELQLQDAFSPTLVVSIWNGDGGSPSVFGLTGPTSGRSVQTLERDINELFVAVAGVEVELIVSVNVVAFGPTSARTDGTPFSAVSGAELQILTTDGGIAREWIFRGDGAQFAEWASGASIGIETAQGAVSNEFPLPDRSDGETPIGIRYVADMASLTGVLGFRDGESESDPYAVYRWQSDAGSSPTIVPHGEWRPSSATYDGTIRTGRTGTYEIVDGINTEPEIGTWNGGSLWYAGQYRLNGRPDSPLVDVYSQASISRGVKSMTVTIATFHP